MKKVLFTSLALVMLIFLGISCSPRIVDPGPPEPIVILVSLDGYRADYFDRYPAPHLAALAGQGVRAASMLPAYPSKTFPNHYTLVTGLYPANHGIVANVMYDPVFDETFTMSKRREVENPRWWEGEPLWVTAEIQGVPAATYFWPGSEAPIKGVRPTFWKRYDGSIPGEARVDEVLSWLDLEENARPRFITLYFSDVDSKGHVFGPESEEVVAAIEEVDALLGRLVSGIRDRGLEDRVNLVVVSDHGMAAADPENLVFLSDYVALDAIQLIETTPVAMLNGKDDNTQAVFEALQNAHPALKVYRSGNYPADWHWEGHRRIPEIAAVVDEGWTIVASREAYEAGRVTLSSGVHGYDRRLASMGALFVASGPAFKQNSIVPAFENIHIYPLLAHILALKPAKTDGTLDAVDHLLK